MYLINSWSLGYVNRYYFFPIKCGSLIMVAETTIIFCTGNDRWFYKLKYRKCCFTAVNCGQLEFEQPIVYKGESASLIYTPVDAIASLAWYKIEPEEPVLLYSNKTSKSSTKYTELKTDEGFILMISETELADVGYYAVICGEIWSPLAQLEVIGKDILWN